MTIKRLMPMKKVEEKVGFSRAKLYQMIRDDEFPQGKMIQGKRLWREQDVDTWIEHQWAAAS